MIYRDEHGEIWVSKVGRKGRLILRNFDGVRKSVSPKVIQNYYTQVTIDELLDLEEQ